MFKLLILCVFTFILSVETTDNVGTVLFTKADTLKKCWSDDELLLIRSRFIFQNLLPKSSSVCPDNEGFLDALINYFRLVIANVKASATGKNQEILLEAVSDTLGGFLYHTVLPRVKRAFYKGTVKYEITEKLKSLFDELKGFLRSNGSSWVPSKLRIDRSKREAADPLAAAAGSENSDPCAGLIFKETNGHMEIPMPFFDSKNSPHAIAVPFKAYSLRSIENKGSVFVLVKYYMTATKCLEKKNAKPEDVTKFNREFKKFIEDNVLPKLSDDKVYPAFGSVFRILESINKALNTPEPKPKPGSMEESQASLAKQKSSTSIWNIFGTSKFDPAALILLLLAFVTFLWLLIGLIYYCCRLRRRRHGTAGVKKKKSKKKLCPMLDWCKKKKDKKDKKCPEKCPEKKKWKEKEKERKEKEKKEKQKKDKEKKEKEKKEKEKKAKIDRDKKCKSKKSSKSSKSSKCSKRSKGSKCSKSKKSSKSSKSKSPKSSRKSSKSSKNSCSSRQCMPLTSPRSSKSSRSSKSKKCSDKSSKSSRKSDVCKNSRVSFMNKEKKPAKKPVKPPVKKPVKPPVKKPVKPVKKPVKKPSKQPVKYCQKCDATQCKHTTHYMLGELKTPFSFFSSSTGDPKSNEPLIQDIFINNNVNSSAQTLPAYFETPIHSNNSYAYDESNSSDKPVIFGYDFDTSSSDYSVGADSSESSSERGTPKY